MSDIKRFDPVADTDFYECWASMNESEDGDYVLYEDHLAIVKALEEKLARLDEELADRRKSVW